MTALPKRYFTQEEYLELELEAEFKSQYVAGEIFAMAGAQPWHIQTVDNLTVALKTRFRGRPCMSYSSEMRVRAKEGDLWTYPDVVALCGQPVFEPAGNPQSLLNPQVIFEVLSPSTEAFDRGEKFTRYRRLDSLTDYVLVSSERTRVEHHRLQASGVWICEEHHRPEHRLKFARLEVEVPLAEIYEGVTFPDAAAR